MTTSPAVQARWDKQLLNACRYGHVSEVDILLSKGANINYSDPDDPFGANCLSEASRRGKAQIVQLLIERGVSVNTKISHDITALHLACERGHVNVVQVLLDNGCSPAPAELFNLDTPLHYAAASDHDAICKLLVDSGVDINIQNRTGDTPLHIAVANDRSSSTTMLLELGADLAITNHAEMTPLVVGQLAKCKAALEAMQPFLDKLKAEEQIEKKLKEKEQIESRKNTIKKTLDLSGSNSHRLKGVSEDDELKYTEEELMSGGGPSGGGHDVHSSNHGVLDHLQRDVVFKKGFMSKQGKKFKHFHERYFILWSNGLMNYYAKEHTIFANYTEKSKQDKSSSGSHGNHGNTGSVSPSNTDLLSAASPSILQDDASPVSVSTEQHLKSPVTFTSLNTPSVSVDESGDEMSPKDIAEADAKGKRPKQKRKSTLRKLGLKSDVIRPKGIIDINDLIETQFLEFADNAPGWALITAEREWKFKCKSDRERREWIAAVHAVNYGISPFDFQNLGMDIKYQHNTMLLSPSQNSFIKEHGAASSDSVNAVAQGWMYKLGAAVRGLEQNYWRKRWVSLYEKPARLAYAQHPYSASDLMDDLEAVHSPVSPPELQLNDDMKENADSAMAAASELSPVSVQSPLSVQKSNGSSGSKRKGKKRSNVLKGEIELNEVTNIIKIGNNDIIKNKYRAPTVHVFALITEARTWVFACKTAEECSMWFDRIRFFLPDQWRNENANVDMAELLRADRVKTMVGDQEDHKKGKGAKKSDDDTVMSKLLRKVSSAGEKLGIIEQYSTISGVQPKGTITDYNDAVSLIGKDEKEEE